MRRLIGPRPLLTATGGTVTTFTANGIAYQANRLTSSGNLIVLGPPGIWTAQELADYYLEVEYLLAAGGGGAGAGNSGFFGGCGGGGGIRHGVMRLAPGTYAYVQGAGGAAHTVGGNSTALGLTADGGGRGGTIGDPPEAGGTGGSGGGAGGQTGAGTALGGAVVTATTPPEGSAGGPSGTGGQAGTGGGVGGAGLGTAISFPPRNGFVSDITGAWVRYGDGGYGSGLAGAANTGEGGGSNSTTTGAAGGSGVFIVRYRT